MSDTKKNPAVPSLRMKGGIKGFYRDVMREMRHVNWPSRDEVIRLSLVVLAVCIGSILYLMLVGLASEFVVTLITGAGGSA